jgi:hypothetical protein
VPQQGAAAISLGIVYVYSQLAAREPASGVITTVIHVWKVGFRNNFRY